MLFAVLLTDDPIHAEARARLMPAHLAFLEACQPAIRAAGPLVDPADGTGAGGLWLVEAENAAEVRSLVERDPFWPSGLRQSVQILQWRQVFAKGRRTR